MYLCRLLLLTREASAYPWSSLVGDKQLSNNSGMFPYMCCNKILRFVLGTTVVPFSITIFLSEGDFPLQLNFQMNLKSNSWIWEIQRQC